MIAGHDQDRKSRAAEPVHISRSFSELGNARALGQIATDDDQVWLLLPKPSFGCRDDRRIIRAEMDVGKMRYACHEGLNPD